MKHYRLLALFGLIALLSAGCQDSRPDSTSTRQKQIKIGLAMDSFVVERWVRDRDIFVSAAETLGAQVLVEVANEDHDTQVAQIGSLVKQGIDVLVVVASDSKRLGPVIRQVHDNGIPVICYDRLVLNGKADLYISYDNEKSGELMASYLSNNFREHRPLRLVIVNGARNDNNASQMNEGYHRVLDPLVHKGQVKILDEIWLHAWSSDEAEKAFRQILPHVGEFDGVIAADDLLAEPIIRVLAQKGRLDHVSVVGMDADLAACQRIVEGTQSMTVYKPIANLAKSAASYAVRLAKHEALGITQFINDGTYQVPYVKLEPIVVDRSNMISVIVKGGFHREDEIYRRR